MPDADASGPLLLAGAALDDARTIEIAGGRAAVFTTPGPGKPEGNEDAAALIPFGTDGAVLAVADGVGGQPGGRDASRVAIESLAEVVGELTDADDPDSALLAAFDAANEQVLELGNDAATTLVAARIDEGLARMFHAGDAAALLCDAAGHVLRHTIPHSPIGYGLESGLLAENEALFHEHRHLVSNVVGSREMSVEVGAPHEIDGHVLLLASDGLFDNLSIAEIVERLGAHEPAEAVDALVALARRRMDDPEPGQPSKPDDLTVIVFRRD